jgi:PAS domain S-box-containing protein
MSDERGVDTHPVVLRTGRLGAVALVAAALLVPAAILGAGAWAAWRSAWADADRELSVATEQAADFAQRMVDTHARLATRIADALEGADGDAIRANEAQFQDRLGRLLANAPLVTDALVADAEGRVLLRTAAAPAAIGADFGRRFIAMLDAAGAPAVAVAVGPALRDAATPDQAFSITRRREGGGAIILLLPAQRTGARLARMLPGPGGALTLLRADGKVVAQHPAPRDGAPRLDPTHPMMAALGAGRDRGVVDGVAPRGGDPHRIAFRRIDGRADLAVAVAQPRAHVVARWQESLMPLLAVALPAAVALWVFAWLALRQRRALEATLAGLEQRVAERTASLREGEERLRLAIDAGQIGTWESDLATGITRRSQRTLDMLGLAVDGEALSFAAWEAHLHPADRGRMRAAWDDVATGRKPDYRIEYRFQRPDGTWRWIESTAAAVDTNPATGLPMRLAGTNRDITERREAEERRDLLTKEVNHRARNTLAIVQAILRLTRAEDAAGYARLIEGRIAALARAQSLLAAERWTGAPLGTLLAEELAPFGGMAEAGARFALSGPPLRLRAEAVQPLGMVVHELATNAAKHGALSKPEGRVAVTWRTDEQSGLLHIRWAETGGPAPSFPMPRGVGSRVIEATITGQLGGSVERRWPAEGLVCDLALPLARMRAGPG